jgi:phage repressor protein C with HTH and peptisase S24 domain
MLKKNKQSKRKKAVAKKMTPRRKAARKKAASKQSSLARNKKFSAKRRRVTSTGLVVETVPLASVERPKRQDGQSGDLQSLSNPPTANSESVEELLEEGNALEAEAVQGVESAPDADQGEVRTREVPEDDVPLEYLDQDR